MRSGFVNPGRSASSTTRPPSESSRAQASSAQSTESFCQRAPGSCKKRTTASGSANRARALSRARRESKRARKRGEWASCFHSLASRSIGARAIPGLPSSWYTWRRRRISGEQLIRHAGHLVVIWVNPSKRARVTTTSLPRSSQGCPNSRAAGLVSAGGTAPPLGGDGAGSAALVSRALDGCTDAVLARSLSNSA